MAMALKADVTKACKVAGTAKPVDLVHLSSQTMGDRLLEREILEVFLRHAQEYIAAWKASPDPSVRKRVAHTLKGGAMGIGAWDLVELARAAEAAGFEAIAALEAETDRVCNYIKLLRED